MRFFPIFLAQDFNTKKFTAEKNLLLKCLPLALTGLLSFERMFTPDHVSSVTCHMSRAMCQLFFLLLVELVGGGSLVNKAYPV